VCQRDERRGFRDSGKHEDGRGIVKRDIKPEELKNKKMYDYMRIRSGMRKYKTIRQPPHTLINGR
jgi:hypothetical protein